MLDTREKIIEELNYLANLEDKELVRTYRLLKKVYAKLRKIGGERIRNPVLRSLLKIGDRWLRFKVKRLRRTVLEIRKKKNEFFYALEEFKRGNNKPAKEVFIEKRADMLALSGIGYGQDFSGGAPFPLFEEERYKELLEFLENRENQ